MAIIHCETAAGKRGAFLYADTKIRN